MEKKYIDAELAKAQFTGNFSQEYPAPLVKAMIDDVPTADVEEVKHGEWLCINGTIFCSECQEKALYSKKKYLTKI